MSDRRVDGFFYGLFMDTDVLGGLGVVPASPRRAFADGYKLRLGAKATLVACLGGRAYGMLFALTHKELERLYGAPGLEHYRPEAIIVRNFSGEVAPALCYNLVEAPRGNVNSEYAARLRSVLAKLEFPKDYVESVDDIGA